MQQIQLNKQKFQDGTSVITLTLLHPLKAIPVQHWKFEPESVIRIGRSSDNDVVLYSAVVSRRHLEIRRNGSNWELVNLGANGTYIDGERINSTVVVDGMIIRLASSGPQIQIKIDSNENKVNIQKAKHTPQLSQPLSKKDITKDTVIN